MLRDMDSDIFTELISRVVLKEGRLVTILLINILTHTESQNPQVS